MSNNEKNPVTSVGTAGRKSDALKSFSLRGELQHLAKEARDATPLLGNVAVTGQNTVIYAAPNTGKTLLTLRLLADSVRAGRVRGENLYYINVDDNNQGVLEKLAFAEAVGFEMLAEGYKDFTAGKLTNLLLKMIDDDAARDQIVVLDTLKKFVDIMNKTQASGFAGWLRKFNMNGGTVIALAHTNKNRADSGKLVYSGTGDIVADFDCALMLDEKGVDKLTGQRFVQFENIKRRGGNVVQKATYRYSVKEDISYSDLLESVKEISLQEAERIELKKEKEADEDVISVIKDCIQLGKSDKTTLLREARNAAGVPRQRVEDVLKKYEGPHRIKHYWNYTVGARGKKIYALLPEPVQHPDF